MQRNSTAIGIDLGTTNSCVGVVRNGKAEIIANDQGHRITPSFVAFTESERLIGDAAKEQAAWNPKNTIYDVKRLIGRKFSDPDVQKLINRWPFKVVGHDDTIKISVTFKGQEKQFTPEEISSMVLMKMKEVAETYLGCEVKDAVITVPAYFNDSQRQATIDAGTIAGLNVLTIINEPTAAAIAYGVDKRVKDDQTILIYDFGGGTFDVVVLKIQNDLYEVLAVNGNTLLGGGDLDNALMDHFVKEFNKKHGIDISTNHRALGKLKTACETIKRNLSSSTKERIQIDSLADGIDFLSSISRVRFEELCFETFEKTLGPVNAVLVDAKVSKMEIDELVLVGGSTRIPKIQNLLQMFFPGKSLNQTINPDEAVAFGAAVHAAILSGEHSIQEMLLVDVTPLSLGINIKGEITDKIIERNSKIPCTVTKPYYNTVDFQKYCHLKIYEGERHKSIHNHLLGDFLLENIKQAPRGQTKVNVTFEIDRNGILNATAVDVSTGSQNGITITSNKGRLNEADIRRMMIEAKEFKSGEEQLRKNLMARGDLETFCSEMKTKCESKRKNSSENKHLKLIDQVIKTCDEVLLWLDENDDATEMDCEAKMISLKKLANDLNI